MLAGAEAQSRDLIDRTPDPRLWMGVSAIAAVVLAFAEFLVNVILIGHRPSLDDSSELVAFMTSASTPTLVVVLIDSVLMACLIVFLAGFRQLITTSRPEVGWIADLAFGAGLLFVGLTLVGDAMVAGAALDTVGSAGDPSVLRALTVGHAEMFGSIGCVLTALGAAASGYVIVLSGALPRWAGRFAYVVSAANVMMMPTMFAGTNDPVFISAGGPVVVVFAIVPWLVWVAIVGATALRQRSIATRRLGVGQRTVVAGGLSRPGSRRRAAIPAPRPRPRPR